MTVRDRVARHRKLMRSKGFRAVQVWVPDVNRPGFADEVQHQAAIVNASDREDETLDWAESVSVDWDDPESSGSMPARA